MDVIGCRFCLSCRVLFFLSRPDSRSRPVENFLAGSGDFPPSHAKLVSGYVLRMP